MRTREEIMKLWSDTELCEDFGPILEELLNDRDKLMLKVGEERREAFHAGYQGGKENTQCLHPREFQKEIKIISFPFTQVVCIKCNKVL